MATKRSYLNRVCLKSEALTRAGMWPSNDPGKIHSKQWLNNFDENELDIAASLVDIFVYFSDQQVTQVLERALRRLLQDFGGSEQSVSARRDKILNCLENTVFVPVEGETPNPTDSGNFICRRTRQILELADCQVQRPTIALQKYLNDGKTIVFLDDMVGTGNQMSDTWKREYSPRIPKSFRVAYRRTNRQCYYVCLACSEDGKNNLSAFHGIKLIAAHFLQERDCFNVSLERIPDHPRGASLQSDAQKLLAKYATSLKLNTYMQVDNFPILGFGRLGLTLGFQHSIPDCTLPIYWADGGDTWKPFSNRR